MIPQHSVCNTFEQSTMVTAIELEDLSAASKSERNSVVSGGALSEGQISDPSPKDGTISSWAWTVSSMCVPIAKLAAMSICL